MPRQGVTKTYARANRASATNKTFDDIIADRKPSTAQAATTINRWGKTSFTSKRNAPTFEDVNRKRKASEDSDDGESGGFGDPFSFDSDDDGPSKPKRGMGYKMPAGGKPQPAGGKGQNSSSSNPPPTKRQDSAGKSAFDTLMDSHIAERANNGKAEKNSVNNSSSSKSTSGAATGSSVRTYGRLGKSGVNPKTASSIKSPPDTKKQLSMDSFTTKVSSSSRPLLSYGSSKVKNTYGATGGAPKELKRKTKASWVKSTTTFGGDDVSGDSDHDDQFTTLTRPGAQPKPKPEPEDKEERQTADELFDKAIAEGHIKVVPESAPAADSSEDDNNDNYQFEAADSSSVCSSANSPQSSTASGPAIRTYGGRKKSPVKQGNTSTAIPGAAENRKTKLGRKSDSWTLGGSKKLASLEEKPKKKKQESPVVRRLLTSPKKRDVSRTKGKPLYNPRQWHDSDEEAPAPGQETKPAGAAGSSSAFDADFDEEPGESLGAMPVMRRASTWPANSEETVSKVSITREHKPLFTVVRNVKQAHEVQEYGETQEFKDDVDYIMEGIYDTKISIRCLSTISLATKCTMPAFRMHVRAHGILTKIFSALHDAAKYPNLALCTAAVMYMMSRDRMGMDLEKSTLELMLSLLSVDSQQETLVYDKHEQKEYEQLKKKLQGICDKLDREGNVKHFVLEEVSTGHMAMETLLSLTSRKAGDWFKEELRTLGGLDHIINTVMDCVNELEDVMIDPSDKQLDGFRKVDRCLRVLENVTYLNKDNQHHLIMYKSSSLITATYRVMKICEDTLPFNEVEETEDKKVDKECAGYVVFNALLSVLRILLNVTHDHESGCAKVGQKEGLIRCVLNCILRVPKYVTPDQRFDVLVLGLGLLINMVEHCDGNRRAVLKSKTGKPFELYNPLENLIDTLDALTMLFNLRYRAARKIEEEHDRELEERERKKAEEKGNAQAAAVDTNQSGEWRESESGLEWVMVPLEEREHESKGPAGGKDGALTSKSLGLALDSDDDVDIVPSAQDENDEKFTEALHKAGRHMEDNIVGAYVALLVGCLVNGDRSLCIKVRDSLPDDSFEPMVRMLKKFLGFMNFTSATGDRKSIMKVIESFESFEHF